MRLWTTSSGIAPMCEAMAGTPHAAASSKDKPNGSYHRLGKTRNRAPFYSGQFLLRVQSSKQLYLPTVTFRKALSFVTQRAISS